MLPSIVNRQSSICNLPSAICNLQFSLRPSYTHVLVKWLKWLVAGVGVSAVVAAGWFLLQPAQQAAAPTGVLDNLRADDNTALFARATEVRPFVFPADHGPHNDFQTEWWYYTGNMRATDGREFGYQFTIFRRALVPPGGLSPGGLSPGESPPGQISGTQSSFAFTQIYLAHFAVTDVQRDTHVEAERYSRGAAGLAGAQASPFKVSVEDWVVQGDGADAVRIRADNGEYALDLELTNLKPIVLQGDRGLSKKSNVAGNASYYYSMPRMRTSGVVRTPEGDFTVSGESWLDREWSTSALDEQTAGWDWFSLQLSDNREIMFYQLRQRDGGSAPVSSGMLINADGSTRPLTREEFVFKSVENWRSPKSGVTYPMDWDIRVPSIDLTLRATAKIREQEMNISTRYWEGAVALKGSAGGEAITGNGYIELTGYGEAPRAADNLPGSR
jgi:predicted secreted hydrolase